MTLINIQIHIRTFLLSDTAKEKQGQNNVLDLFTAVQTDFPAITTNQHRYTQKHTHKKNTYKKNTQTLKRGVVFDGEQLFLDNDSLKESACFV